MVRRKTAKKKSTKVRKASRAKARRRATRKKTGKGKRAKAEKARPEHRLKTVLEQIGPDFVEDGARRITRADIEKIAARLDHVRTKFARSDTLARFRGDAEQMVELLEDYRAGRYTAVSYWTLSVIGFALQYVLKPIDIIPDSLPVIGELDDALVVSHAISIVRLELRAHRIWKLASEN